MIAPLLLAAAAGFIIGALCTIGLVYWLVALPDGGSDRRWRP